MIKELSRASASKLTLATQAASACLLVGAGAVFAVGLPERERPATTLPVALNPGGAGTGDTGGTGSDTDETREPLRVDTGGLAARLSMIDNAPEPPAIETPDEPVIAGEDPEPDDGVPPQPFASRVRYLGMIKVGRSSMAFVNIDNSQRVVREGSVVPPMKDRPELGELTIRAIGETSITVAHEDGEAVIELSQRDGPAITLVAGGEIDRVEVEPNPGLGQFETNARGNPLPANEIERRRRALERQRTQNPRDYDGPGLKMPERRIIGSMGNDRPNRERNNRRREQPEQNTGGDE